MGVAVRVAPAQPGQSLAQLAHVHAAILVTIQLLEEATPALPPLRIARAPPHGAGPGGEGRPGSGGLGGGFAAPPPPRGPAGPAPRPLPPQPLRRPPGSSTCRRRRLLVVAARARTCVSSRDPLGGRGPEAELRVWGRMPGDALVVHGKHQGSFWREGLERSVVSILLSEFRLACLSLPSVQGGAVERYQIWFRNPFPFDLPLLLFLFRH